MKVLALAHAAGSPTASQSGRLALDGGWAGAAGGRVGAPVLEYGEGEHREVDAVEARAHDAEVLEDELEHVEQVAREARAARRDGEEERRAEGRRQQIPPGSWRTSGKPSAFGRPEARC